MDTLFRRTASTGIPGRSPWRRAADSTDDARPGGARHRGRRERCSRQAAWLPPRKSAPYAASPVQGIVAVMAAHREALRQVEEKLGRPHPLHHPRCSGRCRPEHRPYGHTARRGSYILRCTTAASASRGDPRTGHGGRMLLHGTARKEFALKSCELRISGDDAKACGKLLKRLFQTDRMRIVSGKYKGAGHQPAAQPAGTPDDRFRQGKPVQRTGQPGGFRAVRRARPLCRDGVDKL